MKQMWTRTVFKILINIPKGCLCSYSSGSKGFYICAVCLCSMYVVMQHASKSNLAHEVRGENWMPRAPCCLKCAQQKETLKPS